MDSVSQSLESKKTRIGVNIRIYETKPSGIQNFIQSLFLELIHTYPEYQFIFFSTGKKKIEKTAHYIVANSFFLSLLKKIHPFLVNIFFDNLYVLKLLYRQRLSIFIGPSYILPLMKPKNVTYVTVIYDLSYLGYKHNPFNLYMNYVMYMKLLMPFILKRTDAIVVPSHHVKSEIKKKYNTSEKKIVVIYGGKDEFFYKIKNEKTIKELKRKYSISGEYCFTNATNHERKNIFGLIEAFSRIQMHPNVYSKSSRMTKNSDQFGQKIRTNSDMQLVITGLLPDQTIIELKEYINKLELNKVVKFLGFVTKEDLRTLYSHARIFIFPSFDEGFGLPILESTSCGCLPICSNTGSLPEVIGNKKLLFNPRDVNSIAQKINEVLLLNQSSYNEELRIVKEHIEKFTWKNSAKEWSMLFNSFTK